MDIVDDFLTKLRAHVPDLPSAVPLQLERDLRENWGGRKPYVAQRFSRVTQLSLISGALQQKQTLKQVFATARVSRATGYRLLAEKLPGRVHA